MTDSSSYDPRVIKRRRRSKAEMAAIRSALHETVAAGHPMTVRQVFYALTTKGVIAKTEAAYGTVKRLSGEMRRSGEIPYHWLADATRWMRKPTTYSSAEAALRGTAETYRRALWDDAPVCVEVWLEKEALAGVLVDVTDEWDVPLMVARGYPSLSFLHSAAEAIKERADNDQRTQLYYFGDNDPSGRDIDRSIVHGIGESLVALRDAEWRQKFAEAGQRESLAEKEKVLGSWLMESMWTADEEPEEAFGEVAEFERVAVTARQVADWGLPTRPTKKTDSRAKKFTGESVELDAVPADRLRDLAELCIKRHVDQHQLGVLQTVEAEERRLLLEMAETFNEGPVA
jgi:hypothetical protein